MASRFSLTIILSVHVTKFAQWNKNMSHKSISELWNNTTLVYSGLLNFQKNKNRSNKGILEAIDSISVSQQKGEGVFCITKTFLELSIQTL